MPTRDLSLAVVGVAYANKDGSNRQFEVAMCTPGEPVSLVLEPNNKADPSAIAVYSARGVQIGYLSADRCVWIGGKMRQGQDVKAIFQAGSNRGAIIRVNLAGADPTLPKSAPQPPQRGTTRGDGADPESGFWPDEIPQDDF